jgi:hypothetical protein
LTQACSVEATLGADTCSPFSTFTLTVDIGKPFLLGHVRCLKMTLTQCTARLLLLSMLWLLGRRLLSMLWLLLLSMLWLLQLSMLWLLLLSMLWLLLLSML